MSLDQKNAEPTTLGRLNSQLDQGLGSFLATIRREKGITRMLILLLLSLCC